MPEALKKGPFVDALLTACRAVGHRRRLMVRPTWIGTVLRLDAAERRLELRPTAEGVRAVFLAGLDERASEPVDLQADPLPLVERWLGE